MFPLSTLPPTVGSDGDEYSKNGKKTMETMTLRKEGRRYVLSFDFIGRQRYYRESNPFIDGLML